MTGPGMTAAGMTAAISVTDARVRFGETQALDGVSLEVPERSCFGLVGESGSGKTTLLRAILGLQRLDGGQVRLFGKAARRGRAGLRERARIVQPIFQDPAASLSPRSRLFRLMDEVGEVLGEPRADTRRRAEAVLRRLGLDPALLRKYPHEVSGGQARRLAIARALLMRPSVLVADEPTAGLDVSVQGELLNLLQDLRRTENLTLVVISHNIAVVRLIADRVAVMHAGRIVEEGEAGSLFDHPREPYTRQLIASWPGRLGVGGERS